METQLSIRIGQGFDVHRFGQPSQAEHHIWLGGIAIPADRPLIAHSDGDVLLHSLCDALLGALGLGDIGEHFADTDPTHHQRASSEFVTICMAMLDRHGWCVGNVDCTVIAQTPRLSQYKDAIKAHISALLCVELSQVNVAATTTETLGFTGRGEGVAAQCVALLLKK